MRTWPLVVMIASCLVAGCEETPTQVVVHLDAEPASVERSTWLQVRVTSGGETRLERTLSIRGERAQVTFPTTVPVIPRDGDAGRSFLLEASLLDAAERPVSVVRGRYGFVEGQRWDVTLTFEDACLEVSCAEERTCRGGGCEPVTVADAGAG